MPVSIITEGLQRVGQVIIDDTIWVAVGTSTTAPTPADTQLGTETFRQAATETLRDGNQIQVRAFITNANLPATMEECGVFMNASAAANSGSMLVRATFQFVKGTNDLTLIFQLTITEG